MDVENSGFPKIHPSTECPKCHERFRIEVYKFIDLVNVGCPKCKTGLIIELFLERVSRVTPVDGPIELMKALSDARDRLNNKETQLEVAEEYRKLQVIFIGKIEEGIKLYQTGRAKEALEVLQALEKEDVPDGHRSLLELHLGNAKENLGDDSGAESYWGKACEKAKKSQLPVEGGDESSAELVNENLKYLDVEAACLGNIGRKHLERGELQRAEELLKKSLALYRQIGGKRGEANQTYLLAVVAESAGRKEESLALLRQAVTLCEEIGDSMLAARCKHIITQMLKGKMNAC